MWFEVNFCGETKIIGVGLEFNWEQLKYKILNNFLNESQTDRKEVSSNDFLFIVK